MKNKTCGECKYYVPYSICPCVCVNNITDYCERFEPKVMTNGDKIRQGGERALAEFQQLNTCDNCIYNNGSQLHNYCDKPADKTCTDGITAWLKQEAKDE